MPNHPRISRRIRTILAFVRDAASMRIGARAYAALPWLSLVGWISIAPSLLQDTILLALTTLLFMTLVIIFSIDALYFIIPDTCIAILCIFGLIFRWTYDSPHLIEATLWSIIVGGGFALFSFAYQSIRGQYAIGFGDCKLLAVAVLWISIGGIPSVVLYAVTSASFTIYILTRMSIPLHRQSAIPFGPHLAIGIWMTWTIGSLTIG